MQSAYVSCGTAFTKKMKACFLLFLAEHYSKMPVEGVMSSKEIYQCSEIPTTLS